MKKVRAFDKNSGELDSRQHAASKTEATRYSHDYKCLNDACGCTFHWRQASHSEENTIIRPPTFAKNPSSRHAPGCKYDFERVARESHDYAFYKDGLFHLRIQFPLGGAPSDRYPMRRGHLTSAQRRAASRNTDKLGASSLKQVVSFIEKHFETLDDPALENLVLYYQGQSFGWEDLWTPSENYDRLYKAALKRDKHTPSPVCLTVVKPTHMIGYNDKGKPKFACQMQAGSARPGSEKVKPVLVCDPHEPSIMEAIKDAIANDRPLLVVSRPFNNGRDYSEKLVSLYLHSPAQITPIDSRYWRTQKPVPRQPDLFDFN